MTAHVIFSKIDPINTVTHSKKIIKIIRDKIKFKSIIISDDLSMKSLKYSTEQNTIKSFKAGCNLVLHCNGNLKEMNIVAENSPIVNSFINPSSVPKKKVVVAKNINALYIKIFKALIPPLILIISVLGSILAGLATPTESAGVGALGAILLAFLKKQLSFEVFKQVVQDTAKTTSMVFIILVGAALFSLVFRGYGGDEIVAHFLNNVEGGVVISIIITMAAIFILGFFLEVFEIIYVVVPIIGPAILMMGVDPLWFGIMIAINLQTSFLTPPFGFALFYLRGVAPPSVKTTEIYYGAIPFVFIQLLMLFILWYFPELATYLPKVIYN